MVEIAGRGIGDGRPCFIIAEAAANHNGDVTMARRLVDAAVAAGADAVKFQTFRAERLVTPSAPKAAYQRRTTDAQESQFDMLRRLELDEDQHRDLQAYCRTSGIQFLSTPFDEDSADLLERLDVPAFKIPSGELTNLPLIEHVARKRRPIILSTGMARLEEVADALDVIRAAGEPRVVLLHCVSAYPADARDVNLRAIATMRERFGLPTGYSDHTTGWEVAVAAVALGACVIEKHVTLDRALPGPDHRASLTPDELSAMVRAIRSVECALGDGRKQPAACEAEIAAIARKSLVARCDIAPGTRLTEALIAAKRPGTGLPPAARVQVIGRVARRAIPADTILTWDMLK